MFNLFGPWGPSLEDVAHDNAIRDLTLANLIAMKCGPITIEEYNIARNAAVSQCDQIRAAREDASPQPQEPAHDE